MSTDLHTLSGAYALNALSAEEAEEFRKHLQACAACSQEVEELQQAAARMGANEAIAPPAYLKAKVLTAVDRTPQLPPRSGGSNVVQMPRRPWGRMLMAAAAVVFVVAGAVGIAQIAGNDSTEQQSMLAEGVVRVFTAEDAQTATMETANGGTISVAASPELNQMAVDTDELPPLDAEHVYQLWALHDGIVEPVGVLEPEKGAFMAMPTPDTEVAITVEPAGGSKQPTTEPIMQVNPSQI